MRVIRSVAAVALAECRPSARLSVGAVFGVASSTGTHSVRPAAPIDVRPSRIGAKGMEQGRRRRGGEERSEQTGIRTTPIRVDNFAKRGTAASERGLPVDRPVGMGGRASGLHPLIGWWGPKQRR